MNATPFRSHALSITFAACTGLALCSIASVAGIGDEHDVPIELRPAVDWISEDSLRGHLSFLASDLLKGRDTPSPGLDIAAEYIAAQFRRAGLEPLSEDGSYFQSSTAQMQDASSASLSCTVMRDGANGTNVDIHMLSIVTAQDAFAVEEAMVVPVRFQSGEVIGEPIEHNTKSIVILTDMPMPESVARDAMGEHAAAFAKLQQTAGELDAVAILTLDATRERGNGLMINRRRGRAQSSLPVIALHGQMAAELRSWMDDDKKEEEIQVSLAYQPPVNVDVPVQNVVGLLRGSNEELADEYVLVTAHYDHVGIGREVDGDGIYNGANDDGSGTVSVIEIASALAQLPVDSRPGRSIVFMCFFGEERGLLGSRYYLEHPLVPLTETIAMINLEHLGRTDDSEGESVRRVMPTGFDYSTAIEHFVAAGNVTGIDVVHHPRNSASFFARSDNVAFAAAGVPAHTFCAAFIFPDYHGAGDHWDRVDYANLAAVNRMLTVGIVNLANATERPRWNEENRATGRYVEAWQKLHGAGD